MPPDAVAQGESGSEVVGAPRTMASMFRASAALVTSSLRSRASPMLHRPPSFSTMGRCGPA
jgi:hypothetical protein